jgi:hypothetical protein
MLALKVGDMVLVKPGRSRSSKLLNGKIGKILIVTHCLTLDIEETDYLGRKSGLWLDEVEPYFGITDDDYE